MSNTVVENGNRPLVHSTGVHFYAFFAFIAFMAFLGAGAAAAAFFIALLLFAIVWRTG